MEDMTKFLNNNSSGIAILDSTNPTHERRVLFMNTMQKTGAKILFVNVENDNPQFLDAQIADVALTSPDYKGTWIVVFKINLVYNLYGIFTSGMKPEDAIADYRQRLKTFEDTFEPLGSHPDESNWYD